MRYMTDKWQIFKGIGDHWLVMPPRELYNALLRDIVCFSTGAEAIAAFAAENQHVTRQLRLLTNT